MLYVPALKVGLNDVKALLNIEWERKVDVAPILTMRGLDKHLQDFLRSWGAYRFFIDVSRAAADAQDGVISERDLNNPSGNFKNKADWFLELKAQNEALVPVISWLEADSPRQVTQFGLRLLDEHDLVAVRVHCPPQIRGQAWVRLINLLNAFREPERVIIILDFGANLPESVETAGALHKALNDLAEYEVSSVVLLSSSFPSQKPASGTTSNAVCHDVVWQSEAQVLNDMLDVVYGDYAGTHPAAAVDYVPGMAVIPFVSYYSPNEWWLKRLGKDKEFENYVELARDLRALPGYHYDDFCWGTREISRIALGNGGHGNNGTWNGIRANQHICAMLEFIKREAEDGDLDFDDLI